MTLLERALVEVVTVLESLQIDYMVIGRPKDIADAEAITRRRVLDLDVAYLEPRIRELASLLEKPEIVTKWETWRSQTP